MLFRIEATDSGWIVEGGFIEVTEEAGGYEFVVLFKDVATDDDDLGSRVLAGQNEEQVLMAAYEEKQAEKKLEKKGVPAQKKDVKKRAAKKKITRKSAATNDKTNMATGDGLS